MNLLPFSPAPLPLQQIGKTPNISSSLNFLAWLGVSSIPSGDLITKAQDFVLYCQLVAIRLKPISSIDGSMQRACVVAYFPHGYYEFTSPLIGAEYVKIQFDGIMVRNGTSGAITNFYNGDTTSKALANLFQPTLIITPRSHCESLNLFCNSADTDRGSGAFFGKNWTVASAGVTQGGSGYNPGDLLYGAQPSVYPYIAVVYQVATTGTGGSVLSVTIHEPGAYSLPPVLQAQQWTAANGFPGIFDTHGNIAIASTSGTGTGASIAPAWQTDWTVSGGASYLGGRGGLITSTIIGHFNIVQSQRLNDPTYGPTFCFQGYGLNADINEIECQSGQQAIIFANCADLRINKLNTVDSGQSLFMVNCSSVECPTVVVDTPITTGPVITMDACDTVSLGCSGELFFRVAADSSPSAYPTIALGIFSGGSMMNSNIKIHMSGKGVGASGDASHVSSIGCPAVYLAYTDAYDIDFNITNRTPNFSGQYSVASSMVEFGSNVGSGTISGQINQTFGPLYSGTPPLNCKLDILDADVSIVNGSLTITVAGTATAGDVVSLTFTNPKLASTYAWPRTVAYTVGAGNTTTQIAAGLVSAIVADPILRITGTQASNAANVITFLQMGSDANNTVVTSHVSGSATEIVTLSNGGAVSASLCGGVLKTGGIYELAGYGDPTNGVAGTGWGKAATASKYSNLSTGAYFRNTGNAASPSWST